MSDNDGLPSRMVLEISGRLLYLTAIMLYNMSICSSPWFQSPAAINASGHLDKVRVMINLSNTNIDIYIFYFLLKINLSLSIDLCAQIANVLVFGGLLEN